MRYEDKIQVDERCNVAIDVQSNKMDKIGTCPYEEIYLWVQMSNSIGEKNEENIKTTSAHLITHPNAPQQKKRDQYCMESKALQNQQKNAHIQIEHTHKLYRLKTQDIWYGCSPNLMKIKKTYKTTNISSCPLKQIHPKTKTWLHGYHHPNS